MFYVIGICLLVMDFGFVGYCLLEYCDCMDLVIVVSELVVLCVGVGIFVEFVVFGVFVVLVFYVVGNGE